MAVPPRSILVLGATSDIATAIVAAFAPSLERVVLAARDPDRALAAVRAALSKVGAERVELIAEAWDALDVATHAERIEAWSTRAGPFDVVVCAVGMLGHHAGRSMGATEVDEMVRTNFAGPAVALASVADRVVAQGSPATIVVLSSVAGARARRSNYVYGSSKAGLDAFAQGLGDALVGTGVRVLVVRPGFVRSSMTEGLDPAPFASTPDAVARRVAGAVEQGREGVIWVPPVLGWIMAALRNAPRAWWRRIAGDR